MVSMRRAQIATPECMLMHATILVRISQMSCPLLAGGASRRVSLAKLRCVVGIASSILSSVTDISTLRAAARRPHCCTSTINEYST